MRTGSVRRLRELATRAERERRGGGSATGCAPGSRTGRNDPARPTVCLVHGVNSSSGGFVHMLKPLEDAGFIAPEPLCGARMGSLQPAQKNVLIVGRQCESECEQADKPVVRELALALVAVFAEAFHVIESEPTACRPRCHVIDREAQYVDRRIAVGAADCVQADAGPEPGAQSVATEVDGRRRLAKRSLSLSALPISRRGHPLL